MLDALCAVCSVRLRWASGAEPQVLLLHGVQLQDSELVYLERGDPGYAVPSSLAIAAWDYSKYRSCHWLKVPKAAQGSGDVWLEVIAWGNRSGKVDLCCFVFIPMNTSQFTCL